MRRRSSLPLALLLATSLAACQRGRPTTETFNWKGPIKADGWLRLRNTSGDFEVTEGTSDSAQITLEIERSNGYAPVATVKLLSTKDGVLGCVLFGNHDTACSAEEYKGGSAYARGGFLPFMRGETHVSGKIVLPRGVKLDVSSVNGDISVKAPAPNLIVQVVNGDITVRGAGGPVDLGTTNGDIDLDVASLGGKTRLTSVNGDLSVHLPTTLDAALEMRTVNGDLSLGVPGTVSTSTKREIVATLGKGGLPFELSTTNGSISVKAAEH